MLRSTYRRKSGVDVVVLEGSFSQNDGTETREFLLYRLATGSGKMVVNLAGVTYVDSFGLATLVLLWKAMRYRNGRIVVAAISPDLQALIELTRLQSLFEIFPCEANAIDALSGMPSEASGDARISHSSAPFDPYGNAELRPSGAAEKPVHRVRGSKVRRAWMEKEAVDAGSGFVPGA